MVQCRRAHPSRHIGKARKSGDLQPQGPRLNGFEHSGHAHRISSEQPQHAHFSWGFVLGAGHPSVNAIAQDEAAGKRTGGEFMAQPGRVDFGHVVKVRTSEQRTGSG